MASHDIEREREDDYEVHRLEMEYLESKCMRNASQEEIDAYLEKEKSKKMLISYDFTSLYPTPTACTHTTG